MRFVPTPSHVVAFARPGGLLPSPLRWARTFIRVHAHAVAVAVAVDSFTEVTQPPMAKNRQSRKRFSCCRLKREPVLRVCHLTRETFNRETVNRVVHQNRLLCHSLKSAKPSIVNVA